MAHLLEQPSLTQPILSRFQPNPDYGRGVTRRRILVRAEPGRAWCGLTDSFHGMHVTLLHDGAVVTDVQAEMLRFPTDSCPGAPRALRDLIGVPVTMKAAELYAGGRQRRHCTHLFDLAGLALAQIARGEGTRRYDVTAPDQGPDPVEVEVMRDGVPVHRWRIFGPQIVAPEKLAGRPMLEGFNRWAQAEFSGDELEAATVLMRTVFISRGRRVLIDEMHGKLVGSNNPMRGVCYSYAGERLGETRYLAAHQREFADGIPDDYVEEFRPPPL